MLRPPPASRSGRDISLRWNSGLEPYMLPPLLFTRSAGPPPDCGVKCRQLPSLVEASGRDEFPGRGTLLLNVAGGPAERFMAPSGCAGVESENRRHPEESEFVGRAIPLLLAGNDSVPRAGD